MDTRPLVSINIPTFNGEKWIREIVESALAQTYSPIEIVVVDDGSIDETRAILASFGNQIRVIANDVNHGLSAARNSAIEASKGDYIALLDHDDIWHPQKLEKQMALFKENPNLGLVFCDSFYEKVNQERWRSFQVNPPYRGKVFHKLLQHNFILCLTAVIPRPILVETGGFQSHLRFAEDYDLFLKIAENYEVDFVDEPLATYRVHDQNFSRQLDVCYEELIQILATHRTRSGVNGSIAMLHIQWGKDVWRADKRRWKGIVRALKGLIRGLGDPIGFFTAIRGAWHQRQQSRSNKN
jgi:glycosyltransferase involved in cell wall biosynthesis